MVHNYLTEDDYEKIRELIKTFDYKCPQCKAKRFNISPGISTLPFIDVFKEPNVKLNVGKLVVSLGCQSCGFMILTDAENALPHYFK
ncbi:MAG: hypothetical protein HeimC3_30700 [Candidatus Heimdallarchaeota archaeon LC_3]|nr:MAG: hypothetical protein HeimC3_30700 [Candidatus Heimdallarchaeota archaeon LC_3]